MAAQCSARRVAAQGAAGAVSSRLMMMIPLAPFNHKPRLSETFVGAACRWQALEIFALAFPLRTNIHCGSVPPPASGAASNAASAQREHGTVGRRSNVHQGFDLQARL
jgi:hypothetical protein